jgi:hypothetical protein
VANILIFAENAVPHQLRNEPDSDAVPQPVAERILTRASELDAALTANVQLTDLRAAAKEAGISTRAFDAALAEFQASEQGPAVVTRSRRRWRPLALLAACIALIAGAAVAVFGRTVAVSVSMVDATVSLRCLSAEEAIRLVRPYLPLPANLVRIQHGSAVLTIRATVQQLRQIETVIEEYDGNGSPACAARPTGPR